MKLGVTLLVAMALLGACSSDASPQEPDPAPTTTSVSPTRAVPTMPAQAAEDSPAGAAAFVHHYVDVFNYAAATGDVDELSRLSSPDCKGCQKYIALYRDTYAAGGYFKGGDWKIGKILITPGQSESYATTEVTSGGGQFRTDEESPEKTSETSVTELTFALGESGTERHVTQVALGDAQ